MGDVRVLLNPTGMCLVGSSSVFLSQVFADEERKKVIDVLTEAFSDHVLIVNVLGGDLSLRRPCMAACTYATEHGGGQIHVISADLTAPNNIDGVVLWFPPGSDFIPTEESGWFDVAGKVAPDIAAWWEPLIGSQDIQIEQLYGKTASHDAWYLSYIGVSPALQRRGLGSQLLKFAAKQADAAGARLMVNTSAADESDTGKIKFYEINGLKNMGPVHVKSLRGVAWDQILMVRDRTAQ
ncbi:hypothetical protein AURDEDRAFT_160665 [Auricularia subglabra TFB-10046 SS5]|nr:hypothetical protein AURDEDRAFT_160665 [Auricularia subglabra TFB-10046 SS5]